MDLRCTYCQTMFAISRDDTLAALEHMEEHHQTYYDAHCPRCRRANRVERFKLEFSFPNWRQVIAEKAKEAPIAAPVVAETPAPVPAPTPAPAPMPVAEAAPHKKHHKPAATVAVATPVEKKAAPAPKAKTAATSSPKGKPVAKKVEKKPAAKAKPVKKPAAPAKGKKTTSGAKKK